MAGEPFLKVEDLVVEYTSRGESVHAVNSVSFELEKGKTLGLVGETGAGKTTIAKSIMRILPVPPARVLNGKVILDGEDISSIEESEMQKIRGNKAAMIFQDPMTTLNPLQTVGQQIAEVIELHEKDLSKQEVEDRASEMLELVGIPRERYVEYPFQFSGGMKQRVVIAMALACSPKLLLADEPTTALDVTIQAQVLELIKELQVQYQTSMILITHDLGVVAETCDDVAVIYAGEIVEMGSKRQIFKNASHPYTRGLFDSLPDMTKDRLHPIDGLPPDPTHLPEGCAFSPRCPYADDACRSQKVELCSIEEGHLCRCLKRGVI